MLRMNEGLPGGTDFKVDRGMLTRAWMEWIRIKYSSQFALLDACLFLIEMPTLVTLLTALPPQPPPWAGPLLPPQPPRHQAPAPAAAIPPLPAPAQPPTASPPPPASLSERGIHGAAARAVPSITIRLAGAGA